MNCEKSVCLNFSQNDKNVLILVVMGTIQNFLTRVVLGQFFVARVGSDQFFVAQAGLGQQSMV